jgi:protein phosphatase-4 regulatory subunit 3
VTTEQTLTTSTPARAETLIVWTEPNGTDVAVSFQDPQGCNDIWDFITEIQRHLQLVYDESQMTVAAGNSSSSPPPMSPPLTAHDLPMAMAQARDGAGLTNLSLSNLK